MVVFWKVNKKKGKEDSEDDSEAMGEDEKDKDYSFVLRYYKVYHESEIEGFERKHHVKRDEWQPTMDEKQEHASNVLTSYCDEEGIKLQITETNEACYMPSSDSIKCPELSQYDTASEFLSTITHECIHSTGAKHRLNRDIQGGYGTQKYSKEELVAEIGASMFLAIMDIEEEFTEKNSIAYISSWLSKLKDDVTLITYAAQRAQKAVNYILQYDPNNPIGETYKKPEQEVQVNSF